MSKQLFKCLLKEIDRKMLEWTT